MMIIIIVIIIIIIIIIITMITISQSLNYWIKNRPIGHAIKQELFKKKMIREATLSIKQSINEGRLDDELITLRYKSENSYQKSKMIELLTN